MNKKQFKQALRLLMTSEQPSTAVLNQKTNKIEIKRNKK